MTENASTGGMTLTAEQQAVYDRVVNADQNQLTILKGYAGTGKTSTAAAIITDMVIAKHNSVLIAAPTAAALAVLKQKLAHIHNSTDGFIAYKTMAQLLTIPERYVDLKVSGTSFGTFSLEDEDSVNEFTQNLRQLGVSQAAINSAVRPFTKLSRSEDGTMKKETQYDVNSQALVAALRQTGLGPSIKDDDVTDDVRFVPRDSSAVAQMIHSYDLIMLDEISMIGQQSMALFNNVMEILNKHYPHKHRDGRDHDFTQFLMCGDPAQLPPVKDELNEHITAKANGSSVVQLTKVLRSTDSVSQLAQLVRGGTNFGDLATFYSDNVTEVFDTTPEQYIDNHVTELAESDVVLTFRNKYVNQLNNNLRRQAGHRAQTLEYGDHLLVTRNSGIDPETRMILYPNGSQYTITKVYSDDEVNAMFDDIKANVITSDPDEQAALSHMSLLAASAIELVDLKSKLGDVSTAWVFKDNQEWKHRHTADAEQYRNADKIVNNFAELTYSYLGEFRPLVHTNFGYAMTVHKSQGSEWPSVTYLVTQQDLNIMRGKPNLSYTAVSRAKDDVKIIYLH